MYTTLTIKTDKVLRDEAKAVADKLGVPLTTVINGYLREFIRERSFAVSLDPQPTKNKVRLWESVSAEYAKDKKRSGVVDADKLIKRLGL